MIKKIRRKLKKTRKSLKKRLQADKKINPVKSPIKIGEEMHAVKKHDYEPHITDNDRSAINALLFLAHNNLSKVTRADIDRIVKEHGADRCMANTIFGNIKTRAFEAADSLLATEPRNGISNRAVTAAAKHYRVTEGMIYFLIDKARKI